MTNNSQIKRLDIGKVAMFGLLAISLLVAAMVVSNSRRAKLSKPITITPAGISVSVPASGRWQRNSSEFSYAKNSFVLAATMHISAAERIQLHWQYSLAPSVTDTTAALTARAEMIEGVVTDTRQENIDGLPLTIATISSPANAITMLTAIVPTDVGHVLSLDMVDARAGHGRHNRVPVGDVDVVFQGG